MKSKLIFTAAAIFLLAIITSPQNKTIKPIISNYNNINDWILDGSGLWKIENEELILYKAGVASGKIRRPSSIAVFNCMNFSDVSVQAEIKSTADFNNIYRDIDVIIGYESPERFYYIHLSGVTDNVHNGIFLVDSSDRKRIDSGKSEAQLKDQKWHHVRVDRKIESGKIDVFFDNSNLPILSAIDKTIKDGKIGFGSFEDTGKFRNISITQITE